MSDFIVSQIRTYVPVAVGSLLSYLLVQHGLVVDEGIANQLVAGLTGLIIAVYYLVARVVGQKYPSVEGVLLGSKKQPEYSEVK